MRKALFILLILVLYSCNVKKQFSRSRSDQELSHTYLTINTDEKDLKKTIALDESVITRTASGAYIEVIPRGAFRISNDGTFEGEASLVRISRSDTSEIKEDRQIEQQETDQSQSEKSAELSINESLTESESQKEVKRTPNFFIWIGIALGVLVLILGLRFISRFKLF